MFKWIESVGCILVDIDGIPDEYLTFPYEDFAESRFFSFDESSRFYVNDLLSLLNEVINIRKIPSRKIVCLSADTKTIKEMMQYHIGTIQIANKRNTEYLPDEFCKDANDLKMILDSKMSCFPAELYAEGYRDKQTFLSVEHRQTEKGRVFKIFYGGRYYPRNRTFFPYDALSVRLRNFKEYKDDAISDYYQRAIKAICKNIDVDIITYVPFKPDDIQRDRFNRFESFALPKIKNKQLKYTTVMKCQRDFKQKELSVSQRKQTVRDAFEITDKNLLANKTVLVIDDIITIGSTSKAISELLYDAEAKEVIFLVTAVDQLIQNINYHFKYLRCGHCGREMMLRLNKNGELFFGCPNYINSRICRDMAVNYEKGLHECRVINSIDISDYEDEVYFD